MKTIYIPYCPLAAKQLADQLMRSKEPVLLILQPELEPKDTPLTKTRIT